MPASPLDSALYRDLFGDAELARLFSDTAEIRAMLLVEGALARAQGQLGLIPEASAAFLHRALREIQIDPAGLAPETGANAVPVPALVAAASKALEAPAHAQYLHWGATSQDIMDTALTLRLRQVTATLDTRLAALLATLGQLAETHAELPMAARTYAQVATPTSFGAVVAGWGLPLLRHRARLAPVRAELLSVSLSGAAGTNAAIGPEAPKVRALMAEELGLADPGASWHSARDTVAGFAQWLALAAQLLGRIGEDVILMTQSGIEELRLTASGASSTMPQKTNPVAASALVALAHHAAALGSAMTSAALHRQQRDATAWLTEWLSLPQLTLTLGRALLTAQALADSIAPDAPRMRAPLAEPPGLLYAEALTFALARQMPRPEAQAAVKALAAEARATGTPLADLATRDHPGPDWHALLSPEAQLGEAPSEARAFAAATRG
ncbi:lyase family protein [Solirhodobacter olei]|uniref:lyase family protein n=1 Tax=Solirhodobacter olei TaxID=2493082 RepID=UPI000FD6D40D|nr:lyase family protein [Solirhodobacter olei]